MRLLKARGKFKNKLTILLVSVVIMVSTFLGVFQYILIKNTLEDNFVQSRRLVRERVMNILSSSDKMQSILESQLEEQGKPILQMLNDAYVESGNIDFNLQNYIDNRSDIDLYIIDVNDTVIRSTDRNDLGLKFKPWSDFTLFLEKVREEKKFVSSRVSLSIKKSEMKKYCYLPSEDGKYIFEIGFSMEEQNKKLDGMGLDDFEESVVKDNRFVDRIILFDYQGISYKKDGDNNSIYVGEKNLAYFEEAIKSMNVIEVVADFNGRKSYYDYVPYEIVGAKGANERNVVQIVYNDAELQKSLTNSKMIVIAVVILGTIMVAAFGFVRGKKLIHPIEQIIDSVNEISRGNFNIKININSGDEMQILGNNLEKMSVEIKNLLDEQYKDKENLEKQNLEILSQKEEINALYEETTAMNEELTALLKENENSYFETVRALANSIEAKDSYTGGHCERVMKYSLGIAEQLELSDYEKNKLRFGSILHDIGKIGIPEKILNYSGYFSEEDYEVMKKHPEIGANILRELSFLDESVRIVYEHHERVDGKGYPRGLKDEEIDMLAKVVCVADAYDAMTSSRPYRKQAMTKEVAIDELIKNSGTQFDKTVVNAFVEYLKSEDLEK